MRAPSSFVPPIKSDGTAPAEVERGKYALEAGATYYYPISTESSETASAHLTSYTAALVITSATIQDCNHDDERVSITSSVGGEWISEAPSTGYVPVDGTGWSATSSVVASAGSAVGGAMWHIGYTGAGRTRLKVVVGGTGGTVRVSRYAK
jgi:hypothetical protein